MRKINLIVVHCTATPVGKDYSVAQIDAMHRARGFNSIGYHFLIGLDGFIGLGRPVEEIGAHTKGFNSCSIGVAYVGGLDADGQPADTRTPQQKAALVRLLTHLKAHFPQARIASHRDFAAKACPCFDATSEYAEL